jgi:hypothetical protein
MNEKGKKMGLEIQQIKLEYTSNSNGFESQEERDTQE